MSDSSPLNLNPTPQFATAEYAPKAAGDVCTTCKQPISGRYYRINAALTCETCAEISRRQIPADSHASFVRGLLYGIGGAIVGLILYSTFGIVTGLVIGYLSLAVGYIVGKAINMGSRGLGGRRYQIAAVILTYAAVSLSAIPIAISQARKHMAPSKTERQSPDSSASSDADSAATVVAEDTGGHPARPAPKSFAAAIGWLTLLGLASPFLELQDPIHGVLGLVILSVGIRIAWKLTAGSDLQVLGPYENRPVSPSVAT
jgi:predicted lipid-binding transport protein (Tim44 family)